MPEQAWSGLRLPQKNKKFQIPITRTKEYNSRTIFQFAEILSCICVFSRLLGDKEW
jgi:hypothetical protein